MIAASVLDLPQPFLAPWAALLVVHATVYRTFSKGTQQVAATVVAVLLATAVGESLGLTRVRSRCCWWSPSCWARCRGWAPRPTTIATTGLVVLTTGFDNDVVLVSRLYDTAIGVVVGLLVNVIVWPPLRRRTAAKALDRIDDGIGALLVDMADGLAHGPRRGHRRMDRPDPRPRRGPRPGVGAGAPGPGERADESATVGEADEGPEAVARVAASDGAGRRRDAQPGPHARQPAGPPRDVGRGVRGAMDLDARRRRPGRQPAPTRPRCSTYAVGSRPSARSCGPPTDRPSGRSTARSSSTCATSSTRWTSSPRPTRSVASRLPLRLPSRRRG